jgi:hypothetical protein
MQKKKKEHNKQEGKRLTRQINSTFHPGPIELIFFFREKVSPLYFTEIKRRVLTLQGSAFFYHSTPAGSEEHKSSEVLELATTFGEVLELATTFGLITIT